MKIQLALYGVFRELHPQSTLELDVPGPRVGDLRYALAGHAARHWPLRGSGLLAVSALASNECLLRDDDELPEDGAMALLPPVSGG